MMVTGMLASSARCSSTDGSHQMLPEKPKPSPCQRKDLRGLLHPALAAGHLRTGTALLGPLHAMGVRLSAGCRVAGSLRR